MDIIAHATTKIEQQPSNHADINHGSKCSNCCSTDAEDMIYRPIIIDGDFGGDTFSRFLNSAW